MNDREQWPPAGASIFDVLQRSTSPMETTWLPDGYQVPERVRIDPPGTWDEWPFFSHTEWVEYYVDGNETESNRRRFVATLSNLCLAPQLASGLTIFGDRKARRNAREWVKVSGCSTDTVLELAEALITRSTGRNAVRIGIALLAFDTAGTRDHLLWSVGRHGEFTAACVEAIQVSRPGADALIARLGGVATGLGREACVAALRWTTDPAAQDWLRGVVPRTPRAVREEVFRGVLSAGLLAALRSAPTDARLISEGIDFLLASSRSMVELGFGTTFWERSTDAIPIAVELLDQALALEPDPFQLALALEVSVCAQWSPASAHVDFTAVGERTRTERDWIGLLPTMVLGPSAFFAASFSEERSIDEWQWERMLRALPEDDAAALAAATIRTFRERISAPKSATASGFWGAIPASRESFEVTVEWIKLRESKRSPSAEHAGPGDD